MYAADFDYYRAGTVAEAVRLLGAHSGAKLLAGGHSLIPLLKLRLSSVPALIDIGRIAAMKGITVQDGVVRIGALTTHGELAASPVLKDRCPIIAEAAALIGDPQVRNRGTIGGNVVHADPASDLPTVLTALGARYRGTGPRGERTIQAGGFFQGLMTTSLADNEILTTIEAPARQAGQGMAYAKFPHPASRFAVVGAAAVIRIRNGSCSEATVVLGGLVPSPARASAVEKALVGKRLTPAVISDAAGAVVNDLGDDVLGDLFASAEYRRSMAVVYVKRALTDAVQRAS